MKSEIMFCNNLFIVKYNSYKSLNYSLFNTKIFVDVWCYNMISQCSNNVSKLSSHVKTPLSFITKFASLLYQLRVIIAYLNNCYIHFNKDLLRLCRTRETTKIIYAFNYCIMFINKFVHIYMVYHYF